MFQKILYNSFWFINISTIKYKICLIYVTKGVIKLQWFKNMLNSYDSLLF